MTVRVLLWADMEGISQITDYRECMPVYPQYWKTGRRKFTADIAAVASGLLETGVGEVAVVDGHGLGWPNLLPDELPKGARPAGGGDTFESFDGLFQVGFHARCGTPKAFIAHTFVPDFRVAIDGALVTESHATALRVGLPLIGVAGDEALGAQLDGAVAGTAFLPVKRSTSMTETAPIERDSEASANALYNFASASVKNMVRLKAPSIPSPFILQMSLDPDLARLAAKQAGLTQSTPGVLSAKAKDWNRDAEPVLGAGMGAAASPLLKAIGDLDLTDKASLFRRDSRDLTRLRAYFAAWMKAGYPAWKK